MNEREEFLQYFRSAFIKMVERLDAMTESQVLDGLLEVRAARNVYKAEFARRIGEINHAAPREQPRIAQARAYTREELAYLISIQAFVNSFNRLRSREGAKTRPRRCTPFDSLEEALNERLEVLRKRPSSDS